MADGRIVLPGGASYALLVIPAAQAMNPHATLMTPEVASRLVTLAEAGATILIPDVRPLQSPSLENFPDCDTRLQHAVDALWGGKFETASNGMAMKPLGKGKILRGAYKATAFDDLGLARDVVTFDSAGQRTKDIAWTHRTQPGEEIYFISNQRDVRRMINLSLRADGRIPELYDPVTDQTCEASSWRFDQQRTVLPVRLERNGSAFIILRKPAATNRREEGANWIDPEIARTLNLQWKVTFSENFGGPKEPVYFDSLVDWTSRPEFGIRHYSGTADYTASFDWTHSREDATVWLDLGKVADLAEVSVNGVSCGVAWTPPYRVDVTGALKNRKNSVTIAVTNTWANRLIADQALPEKERVTWTRAPFRLQGKPLLQAGLLGPVTLRVHRKTTTEQ